MELIKIYKSILENDEEWRRKRKEYPAKAWEKEKKVWIIRNPSRYETSSKDDIEQVSLGYAKRYKHTGKLIGPFSSYERAITYIEKNPEFKDVITEQSKYYARFIPGEKGIEDIKAIADDVLKNYSPSDVTKCKPSSYHMTLTYGINDSASKAKNILDDFDPHFVYGYVTKVQKLGNAIVLILGKVTRNAFEIYDELNKKYPQDYKQYLPHISIAWIQDQELDLKEKDISKKELRIVFTRVEISTGLNSRTTIWKKSLI